MLARKQVLVKQMWMLEKAEGEAALFSYAQSQERAVRDDAGGNPYPFRRF